MAWTIPTDTVEEIDAAGRFLADIRALNLSEFERSVAIASRWRSAHAFPLTMLKMNLRQKALSVEAKPLVAQRLKRLSATVAKLRLRQWIKLSEMQDLGGCRAVFDSVGNVQKAVDLYEKSRARHKLLKKNDYITSPKPSGYRSYHLVYAYNNRDRRYRKFNGLRVEIQLRSKLQHAWAGAVETVDLFTKQALKSSLGEARWARFFALISCAMAAQEECALVPGVPTNAAELTSELRDLAAQLDVKRLFTVWKQVQLATEQINDADFYLVHLNTATGGATIRGFPDKEFEGAITAYDQAEKEITGLTEQQVLLVRVDSLKALKLAYPAYFADTTRFVAARDAALKPH